MKKMITTTYAFRMSVQFLTILTMAIAILIAMYHETHPTVTLMTKVYRELDGVVTFETVDENLYEWDYGFGESFKEGDFYYVTFDTHNGDKKDYEILSYERIE